MYCKCWRALPSCQIMIMWFHGEIFYFGCFFYFFIFYFFTFTVKRWARDWGEEILPLYCCFSSDMWSVWVSHGLREEEAIPNISRSSSCQLLLPRATVDNRCQWTVQPERKLSTNPHLSFPLCHASSNPFVRVRSLSHHYLNQSPATKLDITNTHKRERARESERGSGTPKRKNSREEEKKKGKGVDGCRKELFVLFQGDFIRSLLQKTRSESVSQDVDSVRSIS